MSFSITGMMSLDLGESPRMVIFSGYGLVNYIQILQSIQNIYVKILKNKLSWYILSTWETMVVFRINDHHDVRMLGKHDLQGLSITWEGSRNHCISLPGHTPMTWMIRTGTTTAHMARPTNWPSSAHEWRALRPGVRVAKGAGLRKWPADFQMWREELWLRPSVC